MADDLNVNSNTDILELKRKFNLFVSNYDKGEFDGDFEITGDLTVDGDVEIKGELKGAETQIASAVSTYISEHPFAPEMLEGQDIEPDDISATGKITGSEIVENMSGYSAEIPAQEGYTKELVYCGIVKNGNKLTIVAALNITRTADAQTNECSLVYFNIPSDIYAKLYPTQVGGYNFLDNKLLTAFDGAWSGVSGYAYMEKPGSNRINSTISTTNFVVDTKYYVRYEATFLLADNLINEE